MLPVNYAILYYHSIELLCYLIIIIMDRQAYLFYFNSALLVWAIFRKVIRTIEPSDYRAFGLLDFQTIVPSDHWAIGPSDL